MAVHPTRPSTPEDVRSWARIGVLAAYVAAVGLCLQAVLYLLDVGGFLEPPVGFRSTSAGLQADLVNYYTAFHERQHRLWWNVALRDTIGPLGALALVLVAQAVRHVVGPGRPPVEVAALLVSVGALATAVCDIAYLSQVAVWRGGGFTPTPDIVAFGRAAEVLDHALSAVLHASYVVLALGFAVLGTALRPAGPASARLTVLLYAQAVGLSAMVLFRLLGLGTAYDVATALTGIVLGPALAVGLGRALPRLATASGSGPPAQRSASSPATTSAPQPERAGGGTGAADGPAESVDSSSGPGRPSRRTAARGRPR